MSDYNYIDIAVHGQYDAETKTIYTYPTDTKSGVWDGTLFDPAAVIRNFLNARDCYAMWHSGEARYFGLITRNPLDSRSGYILLAMAVENGCSLTGRQTVNALTALKKTLLEDGDRFDEAVTRCLEGVCIPRNAVKLASWDLPAGAGKPSAPMCYRTYVSGQELETILSFPAQPDYERFGLVVVISATASLKAGVRVERLTSPVKKQYTVVAPADVTPSKEIVSDGERLQLTYSKPGFAARKETVIVGAPSPYVRYEGSALRVKSADESGMGFVRRVKIVVRSSKGGLVTGYTINVNGRPVNTMDPYIELNEHEMAPGRVTEISVASNNYRPLKVAKEASELAAAESLDLVLEPMEQGIMLRLDFGEGRVFDQEISIEKNTPEYSQLHSGNFHGFRAHRVTTAGEGEVYNVDVRSSSKPTAPAFVNVAAERPAGTTGRTKAPVFENVTGDNAPKPHESAIKGLLQNLSGKKAGYLIGSLLAIILLVLVFVFVLPGGSDKGAAIEDADTTFTADPAALVADAPQAQEAPAQNTAIPAPAASTPEIEKADEEYLNANRSWDKAQLKSPRYQALIDAMAAGNIQAMAESDYFAVEGRCTNRHANDVMTWLWQAKGTFQEGKNVKVLQEKVKDGKVNIYELWETVSRYKPAQPNTDPRPKK